MTAQKRETGGNCIGLLHGETEEPRVADISAAAKHHIMDHILRPDGRDVQPPQRSEVVTFEVITRAAAALDGDRAQRPGPEGRS